MPTRQECDELNQEIKSDRNIIEVDQETITELTDKQQALQQNIAQLQGQYQGLQSQLQSANSQDANLTAEINQLTQAEQQLAADVNFLNQELIWLANYLDTLAPGSPTYNHWLDVYNQTVSLRDQEQGQILHIVNDLNILNAQLGQVQAEEQQLQVQIDQIGGQVQEQQQALGEVNQGIQELQHEVMVKTATADRLYETWIAECLWTVVESTTTMATTAGTMTGGTATGGTTAAGTGGTGATTAAGATTPPGGTTAVAGTTAGGTEVAGTALGVTFETGPTTQPWGTATMDWETIYGYTGDPYWGVHIVLRAVSPTALPLLDQDLANFRTHWCSSLQSLQESYRKLQKLMEEGKRLREARRRIGELGPITADIASAQKRVFNRAAISELARLREALHHKSGHPSKKYPADLRRYMIGVRMENTRLFERLRRFRQTLQELRQRSMREHQRRLVDYEHRRNRRDIARARAQLRYLVDITKQLAGAVGRLTQQRAWMLSKWEQKLRSQRRRHRRT
jgi:predicted  nucleic acid-binding Zn-ribbon protein